MGTRCCELSAPLLRIQSTTVLNQKLTKHSQNTLDMGRLHGGKYLCKNLGLKRGRGRLIEGGVFSGAYGIYEGSLSCILGCNLSA